MIHTTKTVPITVTGAVPIPMPRMSLLLLLLVFHNSMTLARELEIVVEIDDTAMRAIEIPQCTEMLE